MLEFYTSSAIAQDQLANAKLIKLFPRENFFGSGKSQQSHQKNPKSKINNRPSRTTIRCVSSGSKLLIGSLQKNTSLPGVFLGKSVLPKSKNLVSNNLLTDLSISNKKIHKQPIELKKLISLNTNITP